MPIFKVLGPVELAGLGDASVGALAAKPRALLAVLLLRPNQWVPTSYLVEALWEKPPPSASGNLRTYVWQLRALLTAVTGAQQLDSRPGVYRLNAQRDEIDLHVFTGLLGQATLAMGTGQAATAVRLLTSALDLWRGEPFQDVPALQVRPEVVALREQRWAAIECLVEARLVLGQAHPAISELRSMLAEQPFREQMWILLIRALNQLGRRADALAAYREVCQLLRRELGLEPGRQLRDAQRLILNGTV